MYNIYPGSCGFYSGEKSGVVMKSGVILIGLHLYAIFLLLLSLCFTFFLCAFGVLIIM